MGSTDAIPAGSAAVWLGQITGVINHGAASEVPCGPCTACCRSSQFILVADSDAAARSAIPPELLFDAPGMPAGNHVMGYDSQGHCPMLNDTGCSIYASRPQACRAYDCRIFASTGIDVGVDGHREIASRAAQWVFDADAESAVALAAVRSAAAYVTANAESIGVASSATARALAAIRIAARA